MYGSGDTPIKTVGERRFGNLKAICKRLVDQLGITWNESQTFHGEYNGEFGAYFGRVRDKVVHVCCDDFIENVNWLLLSDPLPGGAGHVCSFQCANLSAQGVLTPFPTDHQLDTHRFHEHVIDLATLAVVISISNYLHQETKEQTA